MRARNRALVHQHLFGANQFRINSAARARARSDVEKNKVETTEAHEEAAA